jgi:hypothetical protein
MLKEFKEFAMRGNVLDLAIGVIIGAAFGKIVSSLVEDIIMPPVGLLLHGVNFTDLFIALDGRHFDTLALAKAAGAPTVNWLVLKQRDQFSDCSVLRLYLGATGEPLEEKAGTGRCPRNKGMPTVRDDDSPQGKEVPVLHGADRVNCGRLG